MSVQTRKSASDAAQPEVGSAASAKLVLRSNPFLNLTSARIATQESPLFHAWRP